MKPETIIQFITAILLAWVAWRQQSVKKTTDQTKQETQETKEVIVNETPPATVRNGNG